MSAIKQNLETKKFGNIDYRMLRPVFLTSFKDTGSVNHYYPSAQDQKDFEQGGGKAAFTTFGHGNDLYNFIPEDYVTKGYSQDGKQWLPIDLFKNNNLKDFFAKSEYVDLSNLGSASFFDSNNYGINTDVKPWLESKGMGAKGFLIKAGEKTSTGEDLSSIIKPDQYWDSSQHGNITGLSQKNGKYVYTTDQPNGYVDPIEEKSHWYQPPQKKKNNLASVVGIGLALFAPGIGGAIGSALTGTAATTVASQVIGGAILQGTMAELSGGDFLDAAITGAIMAGVAPAVANTVGSSVASSMADSVFREVVVNATASAAASAVAAAVTGKDVGESALVGAVTGAAAPIGRLAGGTIAEAMNGAALTETVANAVAGATSSGISASILNKDVSDAILSGFVSGAASSIGRELGTSAEYGTDPLSEQNQMLLKQEKGMGTSGAAGANLGSAAGAIALGADPLFSVLNAITKTNMESALAKATPVFGPNKIAQDETSVNQEIFGPYYNQASIDQNEYPKILADSSSSAVDNIASDLKNIEDIVSGPSANVAQAGDTNADLSVIDSILSDKPETELSTKTITAPDGSQLVYDQDNNLVDIIEAPDVSISPSDTAQDAAVVSDTDQPSDQTVISPVITSPDSSTVDQAVDSEATPSTNTVVRPDGSQLVYDQDNNLVDIVQAPERPDALVPDENNPNLEPGLTPQERAAQEWQKYIDSLAVKPEDLNLPGSTIGTGEYWDEYNENLKRIMDQGGYTSQWQRANGDRVFVNDDGTGIGINENGGTYSLSDTEVENMVNSGLLNTADSGYVEATGGTGNTPGGTAEDADKCGDGFHFDEARQICVPDEDKEPETQECPEGHVFDLNTQTCVPISIAQEDPSIRPSIKTVNQDVTRPPRSSSDSLFQDPLRGILGADVISRAIPDEPSNKLGLPVYGEMDKFEGPLDNFLKIVMGGSYVNNSAQQPQQAGNMNNPNQPDFLNQQPGYFNYGTDTNIDQNLFGGQNSLNNDQRLFGGQNSLNYDQQLFGGQNSMDYDRQLFANPNPFKAGGLAVPLMAGGGTTRYGKYAGGGLNVVEHSGKHRLDFRKGAAVTGAGDGQSDDIPAMLADGEFVFPADVVAALGNGSTKAGSDKLYDMMHAIRAYHRSAKPKDLPPPAKKSPLDYLKKPSRKARG
jgi:hypothetical protein